MSPVKTIYHKHHIIPKHMGGTDEHKKKMSLAKKKDIS